MRIKDHNTYKQVQGTLCPIEWNKYGEPTRYSIYTKSGSDILVKNPKQKDLRSMQNRFIIARGKVTKNNFGDKEIFITEVKIKSLPTKRKRPEYEWEEYPLHLPLDTSYLTGWV